MVTTNRAPQISTARGMVRLASRVSDRPEPEGALQGRLLPTVASHGFSPILPQLLPYFRRDLFRQNVPCANAVRNAGTS